MTKRKSVITAADDIEEINIEVDLDTFELEDWERLDPRSEGITMKVMIDTLDRLVIGGVRDRGFSGLQLFTIQTAVFNAVQSAMNPKALGKN